MGRESVTDMTAVFPSFWNRIGSIVMTISKKQSITLRIMLVAVMMTLALLAASFKTDAMSGLEAAGHIKSSGGAVLRSSASTKGARLAVLENGSVVEIQKEVFTDKKKRSAKYKWYLVNSGAGMGYVRSDLVQVNNYGAAAGQTTKKIVYRKGAGTKMAKKGKLKKKATFTIVLEAKAKGSSAVWYKIRKGSKYYYVKSSGIKVANVTTGLPPVAVEVAAAPPEVVQSAEAIKVVNGACAWAVNIAADNRFHYGLKPYSQHNGCYFCGTQTLEGGRSKAGVNNYEFSYCCNPFVHAAFAHGGNEKTMLQICQNGSSYDYKANKGYDTSPLFAKLGKPAMQYLKKGDVICWSNHVVLYLGNGMIAESTGGDDNVPFSEKWNNSIRVCALSDARYATAQRTYRYIGNGY